MRTNSPWHEQIKILRCAISRRVGQPHCKKHRIPLTVSCPFKKRTTHLDYGGKLPTCRGNLSRTRAKFGKMGKIGAFAAFSAHPIPNAASHDAAPRAATTIASIT
jgi:hypothetical protein